MSGLTEASCKSTGFTLDARYQRNPNDWGGQDAPGVAAREPVLLAGRLSRSGSQL
ncbi:MAG: hypothetical protein PHE83_11330 [Opitutaceae bacterium]|nr:hypothetical protein [Opitutaceae bacterium]